MSTCNERKSIVVVECFGYVLAKSVTSTTRRDAPATAVVWIRPEKIAHGPFVWHLLHTIDRADVI